MAERRTSGLPLRAVSAAWGWRLELALAFGTFVVLRLAALAGPGGPVLFAGLGVLVLWRVAALRRRLADRLHGSATRRWISHALRVCAPGGGDPPVLRRVTTTPAGVRAVVRVRPGQHSGHVEVAASSLAAALRVREVRVARDAADASVAYLDVVQRDPLAGRALPWAWRHVARTSLWDAVPVGIGESGHPVSLALPEHNVLLGGEPGAGKSAALSLLVAAGALDPSVTLTLLDAKQVELARWAPCAEALVGPDVAGAIEVLRSLRAEMDRRYQRLLAEGRRKVTEGDGLGLHLVVVDELAFYVRAANRADREAVTEGLRDLVSRGRAAGLVVVAATQKPSHEIVPTWIRDLFSSRLALRCTTAEASDTVLGSGWSSQGYSAAVVNPAARGVGFLLAEGGVPVKLRAAYLGDADVADLAARAATLRATAA